MMIGIDISRALRARRTGTERYAAEIVRHLLMLPDATQYGWRLYADDERTQPETLRAHAVETFLHARLALPLDHARALSRSVEIRLLPRRRIWTHRLLRRELLRHRPDVFFEPAHVIPFTWSPRRLPPSVVTIHDLGYHYFPQSHTRLQRLYLPWSTRWSVMAAQRVIAVSGATARDLQQHYRTPELKIRVVHEAPFPNEEASVALPSAADVRRELGLTRPYAFFVGTIQPRKNLLRVVRAYAQLHQQADVGWDLVLAGQPGWMSDAIFEAAAALQLKNRIRFLGYVKEPHLRVLLGEALFFCYPSLFEGFGLPVLEAQQVGVPVMTSTNSALPEVAGDAALLVDPMDEHAIAQAMLRLSQDETLRHQLIEAGYENVKRFSWEKAARETLAVLEEAARSRA